MLTITRKPNVYALHYQPASLPTQRWPSFNLRTCELLTISHKVQIQLSHSKAIYKISFILKHIYWIEALRLI